MASVLTVRRIAPLLALGLALARVASGGHRAGGDTVEYLAGVDALVGDGSYADVRYPPGFPLVLLVVRASGLPLWSVSLLSGAALVALIWWASMRFAGPFGAVAAGIICALSPLIYESDMLLMSDTPAAALIVGGLVAASYRRWRLVGWLVAASTALRIGHAVFVLAAPRRKVLVPVVVTVTLIAGFNVVVYGSPVGYSEGTAEFALRYLWSPAWFEMVGPGHESEWLNVELYPSILLGRWELLVPLLPIPAAVEVWRRRDDPAIRFAAAVIVLDLVLYAAFFFQSPRFVLPAASMVVVLASSFVGRLVDGLVSAEVALSCEYADAPVV